MNGKAIAINDVLKVLMFKKDIRTSNLARKTGIPQQTLQRIVSGVSLAPHLSTLMSITKYFGITIAQLKGEEPLPESYLPLTHFTTPATWTGIELPLLTWDQLTTFDNKTISLDNVKKLIVSPDISKECFGLIMCDSSMDPYFPLDSILIFDLKKSIKDRSFALVKLNKTNQYIFRQVIIDAQYKYLKSMNPDLSHYPMLALSHKDKIIATLVEARKNYTAL